MHWISRGYGYEITGGDVLAAYKPIVEAASAAGIAEEKVNAQVRVICAAPGGEFLQTILGRYVVSQSSKP